MKKLIMKLEIMMMILVLIPSGFETVNVLVHPLPDQLSWEKSFIQDYNKNLEKWTEWSWKRNGICKDVYKAINTKYQQDTIAPLIGEEHFENAICNGSCYDRPIRIKIEQVVEIPKDQTYVVNVLNCNCEIPNDKKIESLTKKDFYLVKTKDTSSLYVIESSEYADQTIISYCKYIPAAGTSQPLWRNFLPS